MSRLHPGVPMPDLRLLDAEEREVRLASFWKRAPALLLFLRHFGCPVCRRQLLETQRGLEAIRSRGGQVVAVGQGTGAEAARMARALKLDFPCLGDPGRESYRRLELRRTGLWGLTLEPILEDPSFAFRALRDTRIRPALSPRSDLRQLGGVVLVDRTGTIRYLHRSRSMTDVPPLSQLLAALDQLPA